MPIKIKVLNRVTCVSSPGGEVIDPAVGIDTNDPEELARSMIDEGELLVSDQAFNQKPFRVFKHRDKFHIELPGTSAPVAKSLMAEFLSNFRGPIHLTLHIHSVALPSCFCKETRFSDFYEGQEIASISSVEKSREVYKDSFVSVEFSKVVSVHENRLRVELEEIPGQIETLYTAVAICPKIAVIPFIIL